MPMLRRYLLLVWWKFLRCLHTSKLSSLPPSHTNFERSRVSIAKWRSFCRGSMVIEKSSSKRSHCWSPLQCLIGTFGIPFNRIWVEVVNSKATIQYCQWVGMPSFLRSHLLESKDLVMSCMINRVGDSLLLKRLAALHMNMKLSWIHHVLMKALWIGWWSSCVSLTVVREP